MSQLGNYDAYIFLKHIFDAFFVIDQSRAENISSPSSTYYVDS